MLKRQDFQALLVEVHRHLTDYSCLLHSSQDMIIYDVNRSLRDHLCPFYDAVRERTVAFHSASSSQVDTYRTTLRKSAS